MSTFDVSTITDALTKGAVDAAKEIAVNALKEAAADATAFVANALPAIGRYINLLLTKQITTEEFKSLMLGLRDLAEMTGLTVAGLAAIEIENTRSALLRAVTSVAIGSVAHAI